MKPTLYQQIINRYLKQWAREDIDAAYAGARVDAEAGGVDDGAQYSAEQEPPDFLKAARGDEWRSIGQLTNSKPE